MNFIHEENAVRVKDENGKIIAEITFPETSEGVAEINRTFVSDELRGQGVAGKLMLEAMENIKSSGKKAKPTCSYAVSWLEKHGEYAGIVV